MNHMKWQHTIVWSCQACSHKSAVFDSKTELEQHMNKEHHNTFTKSQLPMLIQKSAHPASDLFSILTARRNHDAASSGLRYECPLCDFLVEKAGDQNHLDSTLHGAELPINQASKIIQNHIAAHLESIALLSLPEQDVPDEDFSMERESEMTRNSIRKDNPEPLLAQELDDQEEQEPEIFYFFFSKDLSPAKPIPESNSETMEEDTWACVFDYLFA